MNAQQHWDEVYSQKGTDSVSWFRPRLDVSLNLITEVSSPDASRVIDIGAGASTLIDDLLALGYRKPAALDVSEAALAHSRRRLGSLAESVEWITADVTQPIDLGHFDVWHDRAVFHFLVDPADRAKYVDLASRTVPVGGHAVLATFAIDGPDKCSGLPTERYSPESLAAAFAPAFVLVKELQETHVTPWGKEQAFTYALLRRKG